jgi:septal ring-binding cell division protein DamX
LDRVLDANPQPFPVVKPATPPASEAPETRPAAKEAPAAAGSAFRIQLDALSDMDAAQTRKAALEKILGEKIDMVFDAPYYKLRFGNFATKQEAEDKLVDLAGKNLQGFIVR